MPDELAQVGVFSLVALKGEAEEPRAHQDYEKEYKAQQDPLIVIVKKGPDCLVRFEREALPGRGLRSRPGGRPSGAFRRAPPVVCLPYFSPLCSPEERIMKCGLFRA